MKKALFVLGMFAIVAVVSSCKGDHKCTCTILGITADTTYTDLSKKDAEEICDAAQTAAQLVDPDASCSID